MFLSLAWLYFTAFSLAKDLNEKVREMANDIKQHVLLKVKTNPRFILILCISLFEVFLNFGRIFHTDSDQYVSYSLFLLGRPHPWPITNIAMRPMIPLLACPLILISNNANLSFGLINGFFWISGAIIAYKLGQILFKDKDLATLVALSYTLAPPLLIYGAGVLTDSAGLFFIGLAVYLTLKREQQNVSSKTYFMDALIVSFGVLFRETVLFALLFMLLRRFLKRKGFFESLVAAFLVGVFGVLFLHLLGFDVGVFVHEYFVAKQRAQARGRPWGFIAYLCNFNWAYATDIGAPKPYFTSIGFWIWAIPPLIFGVSTLLGFILSSRRKDLITCALVLFPLSVIGPAMNLRYSFCMWPAVIPAMISGMYIVFSKLPLAKDRTFSNPKIYIYFFILVMGAVNTIETLTRFGSLTITGL